MKNTRSRNGFKIGFSGGISQDLSPNVTKMMLAICIAAVTLAVVPLTIPLFVNLELNYYYNRLSNYGTWIQGILTPTLLLVAILTFLHQSNAHQQLNRMSEKVLFLTNMNIFLSHIDYQCSCALVDCRPGRDKLGLNDGYQALNYIIDVLNFGTYPMKLTPWGREQSPELAGIAHPEQRFSHIIKGTQYKRLHNDIKNVCDIAIKTDTAYLMDQRIIDLYGLMLKHPPRSEAS